MGGWAAGCSLSLTFILMSTAMSCPTPSFFRVNTTRAQGALIFSCSFAFLYPWPIFQVCLTDLAVIFLTQTQDVHGCN